MANALANAGLFVSTAFWGGALALTISDNLISVSRVKNGVLRPVHEAAAAAQTPPGAAAAAAAAAASRGAGVGGSGDGVHHARVNRGGIVGEEFHGRVW